MPIDLNTQRLAGKAIHGDAKAYGKLIEHYKEYLYRTAYLSLQNQEQALDAVGECILRGFQSVHTLQKPEYFKTWLTRILINCTYEIRKKQPEMENVDELVLAASEKSISLEERMDLHQAIARLPEKLQTAIILKYFHEMKISEIAYVMEAPEGSVKAYLSRAKTELYDILDYQV